ncbi:hypothetical protein L0U85_08010 [Glycomyces sp. L485]|uniref:hypothetical protein n=1 Tax=Glycomyces sp. L485 TaxID=2909235 RepID=UPI001F4B794C|nr:hypothetical protein [Glycomyces sp. L485]MCH7230794.1 hypothetical protein [Glycomyces sp. L485]
MSSKSPQLVFRWALWNPTPAFVTMLGHSIGTFKHFFGAEAEYVVCTDRPDVLARDLATDTTIIDFEIPGAEYLDPRATWMKWAPKVRCAPDATEFFVDADIFLLDDPVELREFIAGDGHDFIISQEQVNETWPYGAFGLRIEDELAPDATLEIQETKPYLHAGNGFAPINSGLLGQRAGCDLTEAFRTEYRWWDEHVRVHEVEYYDEQGAVMWLLRPFVREGRVRLLDPLRYRIVCPNDEVPVETTDGIIAMHSTYPERPAYHKFLAEISAISGIPVA